MSLLNKKMSGQLFVFLTAHDVLLEVDQLHEVMRRQLNIDSEAFHKACFLFCDEWQPFWFSSVTIKDLLKALSQGHVD